MVSSGEYIVELKKQYYNTETEKIVVKDDLPTIKNIFMTPNVGTLIVESNRLATIIITKPNGTQKKGLSGGVKYSVFSTGK